MRNIVMSGISRALHPRYLDILVKLKLWIIQKIVSRFIPVI